MAEVTWYEIEARVPAKHAVCGRDYWTKTSDDDGFPARLATPEAAQAALDRLRAAGETVRLVRVTREVLEGA